MNCFKKTILTAVFMATGSLLFGQAALLGLLFGDKISSERFHISMDIGASLSHLSDVDGKNHAALYFGLGSRYKLNEKMYLSLGLKPLSKRGEKDAAPVVALPTDIEPNLKTDIKINFLDIPLMFQYHFNPSFYASTGVQLGLVTKAYQYTDYSLSDGTSVEATQDIKDHLKGVEYGLPIEVGYIYHSKKKANKTVEFKLRYIQGLNDLADKNTVVNDFKTGTFQLFLAFPIVAKTAK